MFKPLDFTLERTGYQQIEKFHYVSNAFHTLKILKIIWPIWTSDQLRNNMIKNSIINYIKIENINNIFGTNG